MGFNNMVTRVNSGLLLVYAIASGVGGAVLIGAAIRYGFKEGKNWIKDKLGMVDRVTGKESKMVQSIENADELLKPLIERYGKDDGKKIHRLIIVQARIGIQRKAVEKLTDERMKHAVEKEVDKLRSEMEKIRKELGAYAMLHLRHIIPEDTSPLWGRLESVIQERASAPQTGKTNLWDNLKTRQNQAAESKQESES
jgi:hypothetical protein